MTETTEEKKCKWGCKCCDGNDSKCQCFHHKCSGNMVFKKILILVIIGTIFMLGVGVGKLCTYHKLGIQGGYGFMHDRYDRDSFYQRPSLYPYGQNGYYGTMPMMNPAYWQNVQQNGTTSSAIK